MQPDCQPPPFLPASSSLHWQAGFTALDLARLKDHTELAAFLESGRQ